MQTPNGSVHINTLLGRNDIKQTKMENLLDLKKFHKRSERERERWFSMIHTLGPRRGTEQ
jgi:hypothetical protein